MKYPLLMAFLFLFTRSAYSEELLYQFSKNTKIEISIVTVLGMKVSESCQKNQKACFKLFETKKNRIRKAKGFRGNPASSICDELSGSSAILKDAKSNEYEYCLFGENYFIDSWDLYRKFNK